MLPIPRPPGERPAPRFDPFKRDSDGDHGLAVSFCRKLSSAFRKIYAGNEKVVSFNDHYIYTYNVVVTGHGEMLYTQVATTMAAEAEKLAASLDHSVPDAEFLRELLARWKKHCAATALIDAILLYMNRVFIEVKRKTPICELGLRAWRDGVLRRSAGARLRDALLEVARRERAGEAVDVALCKLMADATEMLVKAGDGLYEEFIEAALLEETRGFCASESARLLVSPCGCGEYLRAVESMVDAEKARVSRCDGRMEEEKVAAVVLTEMVEKNVAQLVGMEGSGLASMLVDGRYWDLTTMHRLLGRVQGGVPAMRDGMEAHFREIRNTAGKGNDERLLSCEKERYREIIDGVFRGEVSFHAALNSCFT